MGIARGVGAEHDELGRGFHIALPAFAACGADGADLRADGRVAHADDADDLHKAGRRRGLPRFQHGAQGVGADGLRFEFADGAVGEGGLDNGALHGGSFGLSWEMVYVVKRKWREWGFQAAF